MSTVIHMYICVYVHILYIHRICVHVYITVDTCLSLYQYMYMHMFDSYTLIMCERFTLRANTCELTHCNLGEDYSEVVTQIISLSRTQIIEASTRSEAQAGQDDVSSGSETGRQVDCRTLMVVDTTHVCVCVCVSVSGVFDAGVCVFMLCV